MWDLLVLGAGPAGCAAAIMARRAGLAVLMIEKLFKRHRPEPGETFHPGIEPIFERLGIREVVRAANFHRHWGVWIEWDKARRFEPYGEDERGRWLGFQVDRARFNGVLLRTALDLGTELRAPVTLDYVLLSDTGVCGVMAGGVEFRARWTADATGRNAWLAAQLGFCKQNLSPPMFARYSWSGDVDATLEGQPFIKANSEGWSWIAPLGNTRSASVSLTVAMPGHDGYRPIGTDVSWRFLRECAGEGYVLLGDAAGVLDPLSSHGVLRALMSGMLCSHLISKCPHRDETVHQEYASWMTQQFKADVDGLRTLYLQHPSKTLAKMFAMPA
jgi:flavin-dependent dehydrogenase